MTYSNQTQVPSIARLARISKVPLLALALLPPIWYALPSAVEPNPSSSWVHFANATGPLILGLLCALITYRTVKVWRHSILTPYAGFLFQCVVYLSLGPLFFVFGGDFHYQVTDLGVFRFDAYELLQTNLLNAIGISGYVFGIFLYARGEVKSDLPTSVLHRRSINPQVLMKVFLIVGGIFTLFVSLPQAYGQSTFQLPAIITSLSSLFLGGLSILGYLYAKNPARWRLLFWALLIPNTIISVLSFYKTEMVLSLLLPVLGMFLGKPNIRRLMIWLAVIIILFVMMVPLVSYGREIIMHESGHFQTASLGRRLEIVTEYISGHDRDLHGKSAEQSAWSRLAYVGPQAFLMRKHDGGHEAVTLDNVVLRLLPRLLYPEKPNYQSYGNMVYQMATKNDLDNNVAGTVFADAYWHWGWLGTFACGLCVGVLFCFFTKKTLGWLLASNFVYLPLVLFLWENSINGVGKYMYNGIIVPVIYYFLGVSVLNLFMALYRRRSSPPLLAKPR